MQQLLLILMKIEHIYGQFVVIKHMFVCYFMEHIIQVIMANKLTFSEFRPLVCRHKFGFNKS